MSEDFILPDLSQLDFGLDVSVLAQNDQPVMTIGPSPTDLLRLELAALQDESVNITTTIIPKLSHDIEEAVRLIEEYYARIAKKQEEKYASEKKKAEQEARLKQLDYQIKNLQEKIAALAGEAEAAKILDKIKAELASRFGNSPWYKAAMVWQHEDILFKCAAFLGDHTGTLNANVMGSGKTLEESAFIEIAEQWLFPERYGRAPRILWITKKAGLISSHAELIRWNESSNFAYIDSRLPLAQREMMIDFIVPKKGAPNGVLLINYDTISRTPAITEREWDLVTIDEVHHLRGGANSKQSARFKNVRDLLGIKQHPVFADEWSRSRSTVDVNGVSTKQLPFLSLLSGTPVQNKASEVWCYLHLFDPEVFRSLNHFKSKILDPLSGMLNSMQVLSMLEGRFIRQDPMTVYASRPDKDIITIEVDQTDRQREGYDWIRENLMLKMSQEDPTKKVPIRHMLPKIIRLRQWNIWPAGIEIDGHNVDLEESGKIDAAIELLEEINADNEQCVVFCTFLEPLYALRDRIVEEKLAQRHEIGFIVGDSPNNSKTEVDFQQGRIKYLLCTIQAAGEVFNFHKNPEEWPGGSRYAIFLDRWYTPAANEQAENRIWRTGAVLGVTIYILHGLDSVDNFMLDLCTKKAAMIEAMIERPELSPTNADWLKMFKGLL